VSTAICASDVHFMDHHDAVPAGGIAKMVYDENRDIVLGHEFVGEVSGLDGVPAALEATRHSAGPPRVVVHPDRRAASR
jgi:threonine dehydrogenase-like Zn-dependent dehydrogenase